MKIAVNVLIMMVAILGNLAVVIVVARNKRMQTTTNYYLVNLAISDLMVTLSCTWVHMVDDLTEGWVLGAFFCKFNSFMQGRWKLLILKIQQKRFRLEGHLVVPRNVVGFVNSFSGRLDHRIFAENREYLLKRIAFRMVSLVVNENISTC